MAEEDNGSKVFELLSRTEKDTDLTVRDDQGDLAGFLDAAKRCREKGGRFRLIDTAKLGVFELEWLAEAGSDIYTSDEARPNIAEIGLLVRACLKGDAIVVYFHQGPITGNIESDSTSLSFLLGIGQSGAHVHLTNRGMDRNFTDLGELAHTCRSAGTRLVYYHHGRPVAGLEDLARSGGWIHISDQSLASTEDASLLLNLVKEASAAGAGVALHVEKGLELTLLRDMMRSGAFVLFSTLPAGRDSSLRSLEQQARRRILDFRAYYLYPTIMP